MIPWFFKLALVFTLIVSIISIIKQYNSNKSNLILLIDMTVYFIFGISWSLVAFDGLISWWSIILCIIFGIIASLIIGSFLNADKDKILNKKDIAYTTDKLIGMKGVVISKYDETRYYCKLFDENNTDIIVNIDSNCEEKCTFVITEINGSNIKGKKYE